MNSIRPDRDSNLTTGHDVTAAREALPSPNIEDIRQVLKRVAFERLAPGKSAESEGLATIRAVNLTPSVAEATSLSLSDEIQHLKNDLKAYNSDIAMLQEKYDSYKNDPNRSFGTVRKLLNAMQFHANEIKGLEEKIAKYEASRIAAPPQGTIVQESNAPAPTEKRPQQEQVTGNTGNEAAPVRTPAEITKRQKLQQELDDKRFIKKNLEKFLQEGFNTNLIDKIKEPGAMEKLGKQAQDKIKLLEKEISELEKQIALLTGPTQAQGSRRENDTEQQQVLASANKASQTYLAMGGNLAL